MFVLSVLCAAFRLLPVRFLDAFEPRKRWLARFARCSRFAAAACPSGPLFVDTLHPPPPVTQGGGKC